MGNVVEVKKDGEGIVRYELYNSKRSNNVSLDMIDRLKREIKELKKVIVELKEGSKE